MKVYDSVTAARYLLALGYAKRKILNVTKVQKLLFIAYGYILARDGYAFLDEQPRAWPYGPVFPHTRSRIDYSQVIDTDDPALAEIREDPKITGIFNTIIGKYAHYTAGELSAWSHTKGSPWEKTTREPRFEWNDPIGQSYIREYFAGIEV